MSNDPHPPRAATALLAVLAVLLTAFPAAAQVPAAVDSALHRNFASSDYSSERFGPARWIENGAANTTEEATASERA
ncbi:MAG: hypothetical protein AB7I33_07690, partial [Gemmatimonadales bacterium]